MPHLHEHVLYETQTLITECSAQSLTRELFIQLQTSLVDTTFVIYAGVGSEQLTCTRLILEAAPPIGGSCHLAHASRRFFVLSFFKGQHTS